MRLWSVSALGICTFFIAAIAWGLSTGTEVGAGTPSYVSTVSDTTSSNVQILPHGSLLLMLAGSLFLALLPVLYKLSGDFHVKFRKREKPSFGFTLTRTRVDLGVSESDLAVVGERTRKAVRQLRRISREAAE